MSEQAARAFMERLKTDEAFQAKVTSAEDRDEFLELVKAEGFDCSSEEIAAQAAMLEETELDAVAAGWGAVSQESIVDPYGILRYAIGFS